MEVPFEVDVSASIGAEFTRMMKDSRFPEVIHRLQRGVHIGPEDGVLHIFVEDNLGPLRNFLALWDAELVRSPDTYLYLVPSDRFHGTAQFSRQEMLVGQTLAQMRSDPALIGRGAPLADIALRIQGQCGGQEAFLRIVVNRKRRASVSGQQDTAMELIQKAVRKLASYGFCQFDEDPVRGLLVQPRVAAMRFAQYARMAGGDEERLRELLANEVGSRADGAAEDDNSESEEE
jgi:chromosome condensin MukBEF MukE localization factor